MKFKVLTAVFGVAALLTSCALSKQTPTAAPTPKSSVDTAFLPAFPPEVLYVVAREYELRSDSTAESLADYMDERLMQLYPQTAYRGVSAKLFGLLDVKNLPFYRQISLNREYNFMPETDTVHAFVSEADEVAFMSLSPDEKTYFDFLNALARGTAPITLAQLVADSAARDSLGVLPSESWLDNENALFAGLLPYGAYAFYRVIQSKSRAELWAQRHYGEANSKDGHRGDAFKHMLVNVLLRRYVGEAAATLIMDIYWEGRGSNAPCDKYMDLHNNYVGRHAHYHTFVTDENGDWEGWARRILIFVEDENNATFEPWDKSMPTMLIRESEQTADPTKYIYWNRPAE